MVDRNLLLVKIDKIREYLTFLNGIKKYSRDQYVTDPFVYASTERFLQLGIEAAIDIGNHLVSDLRLRKPENNREIFEILMENKIISGELAESLSKMVQFRNILVYDYVKLNREIIYDIVMNNLVDIESFVRIIVDYL